jgi:hypothetical protein
MAARNFEIGRNLIVNFDIDKRIAVGLIIDWCITPSIQLYILCFCVGLFWCPPDEDIERMN